MIQHHEKCKRDRRLQWGVLYVAKNLRRSSILTCPSASTSAMSINSPISAWLKLSPMFERTCAVSVTRRHPTSRTLTMMKRGLSEQVHVERVRMSKTVGIWILKTNLKSEVSKFQVQRRRWTWRVGAETTSPAHSLDLEIRCMSG